ncbi:transcriptional regulator [Deinococcus cellulosilyticus NBRC 106333 = KACC 11606]|uniref:Transcriptional regulator n=2 Tax=Deinococcus cellulosilyticus TaxID=401558 RepID=A0A511N1I9_DEIC1|nr:transcriptional regulator [Deinococcus cellulosilyticus NBRC 106333 = KACC 11606]
MAAEPRDIYTGHMKLSQLRALIAIADTGSFSEAALDLGMSQSSVSEALSALETHLQSSLVERGRFGARLTPLGQQVLIHARAALGAIEGIEQEVTLSRGSIQGTLRISTFRSIASQLIPKVMAQLKQHHPKLQLELLECMMCEKEDLLRPVFDGTADLAFLPQCESSEFMSWEIMEDPYMVLVPDAWVHRATIRPEDLVDQPLIVSKGGDCTNRIMAYLADHQLSPTEIIKVHDDFTMYNMVAQNLGICLSPRLAIDYVPRGATMLPLEVPLSRYISLAVRQGGLRTPAVRHFIMALKGLLPESKLPFLETVQCHTWT